MLRIIAGTHKGRYFTAPSGFKTHPMSEKIRGALFNTLGDIKGLTVLDPFGGSGAISLEALSRGASSALIIEQDLPAQKTIQKNITELGFNQQAKLVKASASAWLKTNASNQFDLVIIDPPFKAVIPSLILKLAARTKSGGVTVLSLPPGFDLNMETNLVFLKEKKYGDALLQFYRRS